MAPEFKGEEHLVRLWMEKIVQVQSGLLTATTAARQMNVSRKTYYQKEKRGLFGMRTGLLRKESGRPSEAVDGEKDQLKENVKELQVEVVTLQQAQRVHEVMEDQSEKKR